MKVDTYNYDICWEAVVLNYFFEYKILYSFEKKHHFVFIHLNEKIVLTFLKQSRYLWTYVAKSRSTKASLRFCTECVKVFNDIEYF